MIYISHQIVCNPYSKGNMGLTTLNVKVYFLILILLIKDTYCTY